MTGATPLGDHHNDRHMYCWNSSVVLTLASAAG
jgi:hypothetical protein